MDLIERAKRLFGSNTRVKLLSLFLNNPDGEYYVREITRQIDEQINSVRRELNNLEDLQIVVKNERDRKVFYRLGNSPLISSLSQILDCNSSMSNPSEAKVGSLIDKIDWFKEITSIKQDLQLLISFQKNNLEADVLIVSDQRGAIISWLNKIEQEFGQSVRYLILTPTDFQYRLFVKDDFISSLLANDYEIIFNSINFKR